MLDTHCYIYAQIRDSFVWSKHEDTSPEGGGVNRHSRQSCLGWSSSYDAHLECERLGFDQLLRHRIFRPVGIHCYNIFYFSSAK